MSCLAPSPPSTSRFPTFAGLRRRPRLRPGAAARGVAVLAAATALIALDAPAAAALGAGALLGGLLGPSARAHAAGQRLLRAGVVALGAGLELDRVVAAGLDGLASTLGTLALALAAGALLARWARVERDVGRLVTVGTAICGGSAIAALAPVLRARGSDVGVALAVVFALNAAALVAFPIVGRACGLDAEEFARWCALAIHDTSSVVGAAAAFGPECLELAAVTKLARALWIVPVVLAFARLDARARRRRGASEPKVPLAAPWFLVAFVATAAVFSAHPALEPLGAAIAGLGAKALDLALFAIGLGTSLASVARAGARPFALGASLWLLLAAASLALVRLA